MDKESFLGRGTNGRQLGLALARFRYLLRVRRERVLGRLGILAAVALAGVRTALGFVEVRVAPGAVDVAKRAGLADVRRQGRRGSPITGLAMRPCWAGPPRILQTPAPSKA